MTQTPAINEVIKTLEANGVWFEYTGDNTVLNRWYEFGDPYPYDNSSEYTSQLGIQIKSGVYVWFNVYESNGVFVYHFQQRYNANIGKRLKSFKAEIACLIAIEKLSGIRLTTMDLEIWKNK